MCNTADRPPAVVSLGWVAQPVDGTPMSAAGKVAERLEADRIVALVG